MARAVRELPEQCHEAWNEARRLELPPPYREIDRIVILGMGGSAKAGDIFRLLLARECPVPVLNHRHYTLPPYVDGRTLLIAASFSGNTEETGSAFEQGRGEAAIWVMESLGEPLGGAAPLAENAAKQRAARLAGRLPVIYGAEILTEVAHRWKTQLNESTKVWAYYEQLPEANHNAIVSSP